MRLRPLLSAMLYLLLAPTVALAHAHLERSRPAAGATLHEAPRLLRLEFSEAPELPVSSVRLLDASRREIALAPLRTAGDSVRVVIADITGQLAPGRYTVLWQIAGRDGHPVRGQFAFTIAPDAAGLVVAPPPIVAAPPSPPQAVTPTDAVQPPRADGFDAGSTAYVVVRWAEFVGLLVVIGAVAFRWLVLGRVRRDHADAAVLDSAVAGSLGLASAGVLLLALSSVSRLVAQWVALRAASSAPSAVPLDRVVWETSWGHAWVLQAVALAVLVVALVLVRRAPGGTAGWAVAAVATIALAYTPALSGHAAATDAPLAVTADALHVLAAGGWMGGLFVLLAAGLPAARSLPEPRRGVAMAALVNAFSPMALAFAAVLLATGVLAAWRNVGSWSLLLDSRYGQVLLIKLGALAVAAFIGLYNWRRARPRLAATGDEAPIRNAMRAELMAGLIVLLITAVLVAIPTPADLGRMP